MTISTLTTSPVAARFIEAAKIERRIPTGRIGPADCRGYWPEYKFSLEDINQWGSFPAAAAAAKVELERYIDKIDPGYDPDDESTWRVYELTRLQTYRKEVMAAMIVGGVTSDELALHYDCLAWVISHVRRPEDRKALAAWAKSKAGGLKFRKWCRSAGISQNTGLRRAARAVEEVEAVVGQIPELLGFSGSLGVSSNGEDFDTKTGELEVVRTDTRATFWRAPDARPESREYTAAELEELEKQIAAHNAKLRRKKKPAEIEENRRKKLGIPIEDVSETA